MTHFSFLLNILCASSFCLLASANAYVTVPRSGADTTARMNAGGDPAQRPGLQDNQRSPEYLDDWWGRNDFYYYKYEYPQNRMLKDKFYNSDSPPYYPWPNSDYNSNQPDVRYYDSNTRYYRPNYPVNPS